MAISFLYSIRYLYKFGSYHYNINKFFYSIIIPQYITISLLYNFGLIGNPNHLTKSFLSDSYVSSIIKTNTIYLLNLDSKIETLLSFYLPSSKILESSSDIKKYHYVITSDRTFDNIFKSDNSFKSMKSFDNHQLLMNISK